MHTQKEPRFRILSTGLTVPYSAAAMCLAHIAQAMLIALALLQPMRSLLACEDGS